LGINYDGEERGTQAQVKPVETNGALRLTNQLSTYPTIDFFRTRYVS
jgi:hypothetical protein